MAGAEQTVSEALGLFDAVTEIKSSSRRSTRGLDYIRLGHYATTLAGGAGPGGKWPRKLTAGHGRPTLYIPDEPTTGLTSGIQKLIEVLNRLVEKGKTVVIIRAQPRRDKTADWS